MAQLQLHNKISSYSKKNNWYRLGKAMLKNWDLYLLILPVLVYVFIFEYVPLYGIQIAFKNFSVTKGIWDSTWVGLKHFNKFLNSYQFWDIMKNTIGISIYQLAIGFPFPILLALMMNETRSKLYKKTIQTVTYAPHFLSTVVLVGMVTAFLSPRTGIVNTIIKALGGNPIFFMTEPGWFKSIYVFSGVWQNTGWSSIVYMAALTGIDTQLYEAAIVDGASRLQRMIYVTIPSLLPTATILLILNTGRIMSVGFEKVFLMQNSLNMEASEVISTFVYRKGLIGADFSYSAAVGLFNSIINFILIFTINQISKKLSETSLW